MNSKHAEPQTRRFILLTTRWLCLLMGVLFLCGLTLSEALGQEAQCCVNAYKSCGGCQSDPDPAKRTENLTYSDSCSVIDDYGNRSTNEYASEKLKACQRCIEQKCPSRIGPATNSIRVKIATTQSCSDTANEPFNVQAGVSVSIGGKTYTSNDNGVIEIDLPPGKYPVSAGWKDYVLGFVSQNGIKARINEDSLPTVTLSEKVETLEVRMLTCDPTGQEKARLPCATCFGQSSYKGLTPGQSTRADTERVLGRPVKMVSETLVEYAPRQLKLIHSGVTLNSGKIYVQYRDSSVAAVVERIELILCPHAKNEYEVGQCKFSEMLSEYDRSAELSGRFARLGKTGGPKDAGNRQL